MLGFAIRTWSIFWWLLESALDCLIDLDFFLFSYIWSQNKNIFIFGFLILFLIRSVLVVSEGIWCGGGCDGVGNLCWVFLCLNLRIFELKLSDYLNFEVFEVNFTEFFDFARQRLMLLKSCLNIKYASEEIYKCVNGTYMIWGHCDCFSSFLRFTRTSKLEK